MLLSDRTVLLVDPDVGTLNGLVQALKSHGARCFPARDAVTAAWGVRETLPDVLVCELEFEDTDGAALLSGLRTLPESPRLPAIALSANVGLLKRARALPHDGSYGFEKYLQKPVSAADLADAICCVLGQHAAQVRGSFPSLDAIGHALDRHDYRRLLGSLNASSEHRYTALLRFEGNELRSMWTYDRAHPACDPFPLDISIATTPCALMLSTPEPVGIFDTHGDARVSAEQRHEHMRAFTAVPLGSGSETFGTLCHFDPEPRSTDPAALDLLERAAKIFRFRTQRLRPR